MLLIEGPGTPSGSWRCSTASLPLSGTKRNESECARAEDVHVPPSFRAKTTIVATENGELWKMDWPQPSFGVGRGLLSQSGFERHRYQIPRAMGGAAEVPGVQGAAELFSNREGREPGSPSRA